MKSLSTMLLDPLKRSFARLLDRIRRLEVRIFGGPLSVKMLVIVAVVLGGLLAGGCFLVLRSRAGPSSSGQAVRGSSRFVGTSKQVQLARLVECADQDPPPPEQEIPSMSAADVTLARGPAVDQESPKMISLASYRRRWVPAPGWFGKIVEPAIQDLKTQEWVVAIEEDAEKDLKGVIIRASTSEDVSAFRPGERVRVRGWICDLQPSFEVKTSRGKNSRMPGTVLLAGATIEPP